MAQNLGAIFRPYQTQATAPAQAEISPGQKSTPPLLLNWGRSGAGKTMGQSYSRTISYYMDRQIVEQAK